MVNYIQEKIINPTLGWLYSMDPNIASAICVLVSVILVLGIYAIVPEIVIIVFSIVLFVGAKRFYDRLVNYFSKVKDSDDRKR